MPVYAAHFQILFCCYNIGETYPEQHLPHPQGENVTAAEPPFSGELPQAYGGAADGGAVGGAESCAGDGCCRSGRVQEPSGADAARRRIQ